MMIKMFAFQLRVQKSVLNKYDGINYEIGSKQMNSNLSIEESNRISELFIFRMSKDYRNGFRSYVIVDNKTQLTVAHGLTKEMAEMIIELILPKEKIEWGQPIEWQDRFTIEETNW